MSTLAVYLLFKFRLPSVEMQLIKSWRANAKAGGKDDDDDDDNHWTEKKNNNNVCITLILVLNSSRRSGSSAGLRFVSLSPTPAR